MRVVTAEEELNEFGWEGLWEKLADSCGQDLDRDTAEEAKYVLVHTAPLGPQFERTNAVLERLHRWDQVANGIRDTHTVE